MANRYWVGGSGTWDTTSTTNWSASSGGSGGASVPTNFDNVIFDQAATYTVTMTGALLCGSFTVSDGTVTFATGTTPTLRVAGDLTVIAGTVWNMTGLTTIDAPNGVSPVGNIQTITSNGVIFEGSIQFGFDRSVTTVTYILQDNLTLGSTRTTTFQRGILNLNNNILTTGLFNATASNSRTLAFGTGKIVLNSSTTSTIWNASGAAATMAVTGSGLVECTGGGVGVTKTIQTPGNVQGSQSTTISFSLLETSGSVTYTFPNDSIIKDLVINGTQSITNNRLYIYGSYTYSNTNGTTTFTAGTNAWTFAATTGSFIITPGAITYGFPWTFGWSAGTIPSGASTTTTWTLASNLTLTAGCIHDIGTLALSSYTLTSTTFSTANTNTRTLNFGTGKIVLTNNATSTIWNSSTVTGLTISGTPLVECQGGGTAITKTISTGALSEANSISFSLLETTGTVTYAFTASNVVKNLTINGVQTVSNIAISIRGNFLHQTTNGTTTFTAGTNAWTFAGTSGSKTITTPAVTYDFPWTFNGTGSTWQLQNNITLGSTRAFTLTNGTFDFNNFSVSGPTTGVTISTGSTTALNSTGTLSLSLITHTSGTLTLGSNLTITSASGYTLTAGTLALSTFTLTTPLFASNNSNTRSINFGTGKIVLTTTATNTIWNTSTVTGLTVSGTTLVECTGGPTQPNSPVTKTINTGTLSEANSISFSLIETAGTVTYAFTASNAVKNLTVNGVQTVSNIAISIYGNFLHQTTNGTTTFTAGTNAWTFAGASGTKTITTPAVTYDFPWTFNGTGSTWQLQNAIALGATRQLTLTNGTFDLNNRTVSGAGITMVTGSATLTSTGGTPTLAVPFTHTSGTLTLGANTTTTSTYTLTAGTLTLNNLVLSCSRFISSGSTARTLAFGTSSELRLTGDSATIFDVTTATNFATTGTIYINSTYTGSAGTRTLVTGFTAAQAAGYDIKTSGTTGVVIGTTATDTVAITGNWEDVDLTGFTNTLSNTARTLYGILTLPASGGTFTAGTNATTFGGTTGTKNITTNGRTLDFPLTFNGAGSTWLLQGSITLGPTATSILTVTAGILDLNNLTFTAPALNITGSTARAIYYGTTGQVTLTGNNMTVLEGSTLTNLSANTALIGTLRIYFSYAGSTGTRVINFAIAGGWYYDFLCGNSAVNDSIVINPSSDTITVAGQFKNFNLTNFTGTLSNSTRTIRADLILPSTVTTAAGALITTMTGNDLTSLARVGSIQTNGVTVNFPISITGGGPSGYRFDSSFTSSTSLTYTGHGGVTTAVKLDLNDFVITVQSFVISAGSQAGFIIDFKTSSQILLTGNNTTVFNVSGAPTTTTTSAFQGAVYIKSTYTGATGTRTFSFSGITSNYSTWRTIFPTLVVTGSSGIIIGDVATDTVSLGNTLLNVDLTGLTNTISNGVVSIYGDLTLPATGGTFTAGTNAWTFASTTSQNINGNGRLLDFPVTFNGAAGTFVLTSTLKLGSTRTAMLTQGTLNLNNNILETGIFASSNSNTRVLAYGTSGELRLTGSNTTIFDISTYTGFSNTGTVYINSTYTGATGIRTFTTGGTTTACFSEAQAAGYDIKTSGTSGVVFGTTATDSVQFSGGWGNVDLTGLTNTFNLANRVIYGNLTLPASGGTLSATSAATIMGGRNSTFTITTNGRSIPFPISIGGSPPASTANYGTGSTFNLNGALTLTGSSSNLQMHTGTLNLNDFSVTANLLEATTNSANPVINFGTTGTNQINVTSSTFFLSTPNGSNLTFGGTVRIYATYTGGGVNARSAQSGTYATSGSGLLDVSIGTSGTGIVIFPPVVNLALSGRFGSLDITGMSGALTNSAVVFTGNVTIPTTGTLTAGTNAFRLWPANNTNPTFTTNGRTLDFPLQFDPGTNSSYTLLDSVTLGSTRALTISGTHNLNGMTITAASCTWGNNTGTLTFNGGSIVLTGSGTAWSAGTFGTTAAGTGTGTISMTSATAKTFAGNGRTYNCTLNQGGAGALTITGANTFNDITATSRPSTITFPASTTTTVNNFTLAGTAGNLVTINSATAGTRTTIAKSGGGTVSTNYLSVQDISFTPYATDGSAAMTWYLGSNTTNTSNNLGAAFTDGSTKRLYVLASGTSWTLPSNFDVNNNTVHIIGAGGGGSGSLNSSTTVRVAGAGGGGGGYSKITNLSGFSGQSFAYSIGAGGTAGTGGTTANTAGNGGDTTFNSITAPGGKGGATTASASTGGAGGIGTTFTGGAGGSGSGPTANTTTTTGGGGGGGAAGPLGAGRNGGNGFGSTTAANTSGGGGGGNGGGTTAGGNGASLSGGTGGNNAQGTGGGASNTAGTKGGGGGGAVGAAVAGKSGGAGIDIENTIGGGGGTSGATQVANSATAALYGAGGGGAGNNTTTGVANGSAGAQGAVIIVYTLGTAPLQQESSSSNMLLMFN